MPSSPNYTPLNGETLPLVTRLKLLLFSKRALPLLILIPVLSVAFVFLPPITTDSDTSSPSYYSSAGGSSGWLPSLKNSSSSWFSPSTGSGSDKGSLGGYATEGKVDGEGKGVNHRYGMNLHDAFIHISHASEGGKFTGRETRWLRGLPGYSQSCSPAVRL